ncbi:MAG: nuclear transport factor 2 family protein [Gaiellaceae bacterium]
MTLDELDRWLDVYGRAWERKDSAAFVACFADGALYAWGPWTEPLRGREAIEARFERAVSRQENVRFGHEPLAITPDGRGVARWWVSMDVPADGTVEEDEGVFLVTLDGDGLCSEFREWWNGRSRPA